MDGLIEFSGETGAEILRLMLLLVQHGYKIGLEQDLLGRLHITVGADVPITIHANPDLAAASRNLVRAAHLLGVAAS